MVSSTVIITTQTGTEQDSSQICPWTWLASRHVGVWGIERIAPQILSSAPDGVERSVSGPAIFTWQKQPLRITKQETGCVLQPIQTLSRRKEPLEGLRILCNNIYGLHTGKHLKHYSSESLHATCISLSFLFVYGHNKQYVSCNTIFLKCQCPLGPYPPSFWP
jgi:hypothetical protein